MLSAEEMRFTYISFKVTCTHAHKHTLHTSILQQNKLGGGAVLARNISTLGYEGVNFIYVTQDRYQ
jgi:hypothetical protein